ncbi:unnamed protein product (macronuclear) [Paramecium tetraurelia]|uniref:Uncharacterized protein n=1 Tax=Paramecium tetraurelia TaxID=5888 RepID=A0CTA7_PARTE|nr:uncharacterized protein GSPATT00010258001 [Paramecium tetraurelia]CAK74024.1 unnamed protein product [Paramecium tetraurelia]|eukprot:XP_001441421.1 hypothetical protein (macronuclear) [Paramecium tetraurelia strain d4-2]
MRNEFNKEKEFQCLIVQFRTELRKLMLRKKAFYIYPNSDDFLLMFDLEGS